MAGALFEQEQICLAVMVINTNVGSVKVANMMRSSVSAMNDSLARLSSGSRIVHAADDAAGVAVATKFSSQTNRINAVRNTLANTLSFVQTADGFLQKANKALHRMGELATMAMDKTKSAGDLDNYNIEFQDLKKFMRDMQDRQMNGKDLFKGDNISVTNDAHGQSFSYTTAKLDGTTYSKMVDGDIYEPPPFTWQTTKETWKVSKNGYMLRQDANKITEKYYTISSDTTIFYLKQEAWYKEGVGWSTTNNGGTKYNAGSFIKEYDVAGHPDITHNPATQLGNAYAVSYGANVFISKHNPATTGNGNIEASEVITHNKDTFTNMDLNAVDAAIRPASDFYQRGSFLAADPGAGISTTALSAGGMVSVNPITSGEDTAATNYAAGAYVTSDPTDVDVDPDAEETSQSHVLTNSGAKTAIKRVQRALEQLTSDRASLGTVMGRVHRTHDQLGVLRENLSQAVSRITDTNMAKESTKFARHQILVNSSTDMLKHANIVPQHALRLILGL